jgi:polysaccharide export outer membrane protein
MTVGKRYMPGRQFAMAIAAAMLTLGCAASSGQPDLGRAGATRTGATEEPAAGQFAALTPFPAASSTTDTADDLGDLPPPPTRYTLGPGDVVTVTVWGHPELSGKHVVGPDGDIQLPFVGSIKIANLSADDASAKLTGALRELYVASVASLTIESYNGNQVYVLGNVAHPGALHFSEPPTLLEALAKAGANGSDKDGLGGMSAHCAIVRGRDRLLWIDLRPLLRGRDASLNIALQRNDLIYVPDADAELIYVMGEVKNPGAYPLTANMSFLEALTRAGGTTDNAQPGKIVLERPTQKQQEVINLKQMVKEGQANYQLEAGDIVYVPKSGLANFGWVMQQINPITTMALFGAAL